MANQYVRVRPAGMGGPVAVRHPEHGEYDVPNPATPYPADLEWSPAKGCPRPAARCECDVLVREYPWLFVSDARDAPAIEQATRSPGERRPTRRG